MIDNNESKSIIGRAEKISLPEADLQGLHARIDTGANTSAIWASQITEQDGQLAVVFMGEGHAAYTGSAVLFSTYDQTVVASSTGHKQIRYKVRLLVSIGGRRIRAWFTLADRSTQVYPVLIGRNVLRGKFIVDVKHGKPLRDAEKRRTEELRSSLTDENKE
jgi:hypothetical protein